MVVTVLPATDDSEVWHERTAWPSRCTVQAPQRPAPHPYLVPVIFRCSRTTQSSGVSGCASTLTALPLMVNPTAVMRLSSSKAFSGEVEFRLAVENASLDPCELVCRRG